MANWDKNHKITLFNNTNRLIQVHTVLRCFFLPVTKIEKAQFSHNRVFPRKLYI